MNTKKLAMTSLVLFCLSLTAAPAFGKDVGNYAVRINVDNRTGGKWNDLATALFGWTCFSSSEVKYAERLRDNHGQEKIIARKSNANWDIFSNASVDLRFDRDMEAGEPQLGVTVTEQCSKTTYHSEESCSDETDSDGNSHEVCHTEEVPETQTAYMNWDCSMGITASEVGQSQHTECHPGNSNFASFSFEAWALTALRDKKFSADLNMTGHEEKFAQDFCAPGEKQNKVIVRLTQGVAGNWMQHKYIFSFNVAGHAFTLDNTERGNGIINDDIAVCGAGKDIPITVTAIAKNLIFPNSHFTPDQPEHGSLDLNRTTPGNEGTIYLRRHAFLGNWTTNPDNWLAASVRDLSEAPPAPAPLAAASAIGGLDAIAKGLQPGIGLVAANDSRDVKPVARAPGRAPALVKGPGRATARAVN